MIPHRHPGTRRAFAGAIPTILLGAFIAACQASVAPASSPVVVASQGPVGEGSTSSPSPTSPTATTTRQTPAPLPLAIPRPTDLVTDGRCEAGQSCLGLLAPGSYHTKVFQPGFTFSLATTGWENLADGGGDFALLSVTTPGDAIYFFRHPRATKPDGTLDSSGGNTARSLTDWLGANDAVSVTPAKAVSVGSLRGWTTDLTVSPGTVAHLSDCPAQVCVGLFRGKDPSSKPTWQWDWGSAGPERQRLYLLQASNDVVLIVVDSLDGDTFDSLSQAARAIVESVTFDKP